MVLTQAKNTAFVTGMTSKYASQGAKQFSKVAALPKDGNHIKNRFLMPKMQMNH
jgi:hypothetical protein